MKKNGAKLKPRARGSIGDRVTQYRKKAAMTQFELAFKAGVGLNTIYRLEHNVDMRINMEFLERIANALSVPLPILLFGEKGDL